ncbi:MAG: DUF503 family protein [Acidimicrobiales bacterium]
MEIRNYEIIYKLLEDIENAIARLASLRSSKRSSPAKPRSARSSGCPGWAGSPVVTSSTVTITRGSKVRFLRDGTIIWKGDGQLAASIPKDDVERSSPDSSAASASPTSKISRKATSSAPTRSGDPPHLSRRTAVPRSAGRCIPSPRCAEPIRRSRHQSLKAKRSIVQSIVRTRRRMDRRRRVEVGHQDLWQRTAIGIAVVGSSAASVEERADAVERYVWSRPDIEVLEITWSWLG